MAEIELEEGTTLSTLSVHERFVEARTLYNQHGKQTMDEVAEATKLQKSMIWALEKDDTRGSSFRDVAKLAKHYGVSMDWLCGLSEVKTANETLKGVCEKTGLSDKAAESLVLSNQFVKDTDDRYVTKKIAICRLAFYSSLIENIPVDDIYSAFQQISAIKAEGMLDEYKQSFRTKNMITLLSGRDIIDFLNYESQAKIYKCVRDFFEEYFSDGRRW